MDEDSYSEEENFVVEIEGRIQIFIFLSRGKFPQFCCKRT